ncbi:MAG TPA: hypothetical protein VGW78_04435 [Candidatus Babeliales bacterium]|jgi:hypothetical protein|nr:hypothetical protein [Candidatus Babeliales bacterium]
MSSIRIKTKFNIILVLSIIIVQLCAAFEPIIVYADLPHNNATKQPQNYACSTHNNQVLQTSYTTESYLHTYSACELAHYFAQHGYSAEQVLRHHELYTNPEFITLIKSYPEYKEYITYLNRKLQKKSGFAKWLGTWTDTHRKGFTKCVQQLYHELEQTKRSKESVNQIRNNLQHAWDQQQKLLQGEVSDWYDLSSIYQTYNCGDSAHIQRRCDALEDTVTHGVYYVQQTYTLNSNVQNMLCSSSYDPSSYTSCYGNQLQQAIHQECITLLARTTTLPKTSAAYVQKEVLVDCIDAAREYNQAGLVHKASIVTDFCWALLDYSSAIVEGAAHGIVGAVYDMIEHPIQTAACVIAGEYVLAYQLCKVLCNVTDIGITALVNTSRAKEKWDAYIEPINNIIKKIKNKEVTCRDVIKAGTSVTVGLVAQHKLLGGLNKFYSGIRAKAMAFTHNNPSLTPQQYLQTAEGILLKSSIETAANFVEAHGNSGCPASCTQMYEKLKLALKIEEFTSIIKVTKHGVQRLIERGFTPEEIKILYHTPDIVRTQNDGAQTFIKIIEKNRYNIMIYNQVEKGVITALKSISERDLINLGKKYGWTL